MCPSLSFDDATNILSYETFTTICGDPDMEQNKSSNAIPIITSTDVREETNEANLSSTATCSDADMEQNTILSKEDAGFVENQYSARRKKHCLNMELATSCIQKKKRVTSSLCTNDNIIKYLDTGGFGNYLRSKLNKKDSAILEIAKRLSQFVYYITTKFNKPHPVDGNYQHFLINAIETPTTIVTYMDYCSEVDGYQPCSLTVRLDDLSNFIHFVTLYEASLSHDFIAAHESIRQYRKLLKKMQANEDKKKKSAEAILAARKFPVGGLAELQTIMDSDMSYFETRCEQFLDSSPPQGIYTELIGFVVASLWVYSPQARAAAIETLSLSDGIDLLKSRSIGSSNFKSVASYKVQPLILQDEKAAKIIKLYIDILRPKTSSHPQLFLQYNGKPFHQGAISQYMKQYFQRNGGLNLGVNALRKVQCSEVYVASVDGRVSESARKHFNYIQGHSQRSNDAVYVKLALQANSEMARNTFSKLGSKMKSSIDTTSPERLSDTTSPAREPQHNDTLTCADNNDMSHGADLDYNDMGFYNYSGSENMNITTSSANAVVQRTRSMNTNAGIYPWPIDYLTAYDDWGSNHSCADKLASRVPWDNAEKEWLRNCMKAKSHLFERAVDKYKQLLQEVIDDSNARPLFHRNHVADHSRLREGLRAKRVSKIA
jgi:hypothetical protein